MKDNQRIYFCIDMKSFYASVECAERGLSPFETNLVVADPTRGGGSICLAISPKMKSLGVKNRCRVYEIPKNIKYITAMPRMKKYIEYAADIYEIYLQYVAPEDIHTYSIDESFIDATQYLKLYNMTAKQFATMLVDEIATKKHIPATVGIGTNLYLAKIALDITAKKVPDHMGFLDEELFKETLCHHRPLTDFWNIGKGTASHLARLGIYDMAGIANCPEYLLYKEFGVSAELLIDHAVGKESCTIADIKNYTSKSHSLSSSQILFSDYPADKALLVLKEMTITLCQELLRQKLITNHLTIMVGYSKDVIPPTSARVKMSEVTCASSIILRYVEKAFNNSTNTLYPIRRLAISFDNVVDECCEGYDIFTDLDAIAKEKAIERTVLNIKDRFGKNAILRASDLQEGATQRLRNKLVGGHNG